MLFIATNFKGMAILYYKMKKYIIYILFFSVILCAVANFAAAATYYADPVNGNITNNGSSVTPWKTLEEVISNGKLATLIPGDTLLLLSGNHGSITFSGNNAGVITIAAAPGEKPQFSKLVISSGSKWTVKGITISPSFGAPYTGNIVTIAEGGTTTDVTLEDCFIYTVLDTSAWTASDWMNTYSGIFQGRYGTNITLRNNYIYNTRFGIALCSFDSLCEGNVISDFSADAIRMTRNGETSQYNVIKNCYVNAADGDANHDDGIQCFLFNVGTGALTNMTVRNNVIHNRVNPAQKFPAIMQGIGFFDGPLVNFLVEKNVTLVDMWHGVCLLDAVNSKILDNAAYSYWYQTSGLTPWIMSGKNIATPSGNTAKNNMAMSLEFADDPTIIQENNTIVTANAFENALVKAMIEINNRFGPTHALSGRVRLEGYTQTTTTTTTVTTTPGIAVTMNIYPNPITKEALATSTVKFMCTSAKVFDLTIYDAEGKLLYSLPSGFTSGKNGNYPALGIAEWDGTINGGSKCTRGVYYYNVKDSAGNTKTGKFAVN